MATRRRLSWTTPVLIAIAVACRSETGEPVPAFMALRAVSGDSQAGVVATELANPVVVQVVGLNAAPIAAARVRFLTHLGGSVTPESTTTDASGYAQARWTVGTSVAAPSWLEAQAIDPFGSIAAQLALYALPEPASFDSLVRVSPDTAAGDIGAPLPNPATVIARDRYGNPVPGVAIRWRVLAAGGGVAPDSGVTGPAGTMSATWTLGVALDTLGVLQAAAPSGAPVTFHATPRLPATATFQAVAGSGQVDTLGDSTGDTLPQALVARLRLADGRPVARVPVVWDLGQPGAIVGDAATDSTGTVRARWVIASPGPNDAFVQLAAPLTQRTQFAASGLFLLGSVVAGGGHSCALGRGGAAYCWGDNAYGQLGGSTAGMQSDSPVAVRGGVQFTALIAEEADTCGLTAAGAAYCWGSNFEGELGTVAPQRQFSPVPVSGNYAFTALAGGLSHACAVTTSHAAVCWGRGGEGQLGTGDTTQYQDYPRPVAGTLQFAQVAAGGLRTCGLTVDSLAYCWGAGVIGDGSVTSPHGTPTAVAGGPFVQVVTGDSHSCGLTAAGAAYCWGANASHQLGTGDTVTHATPVAAATGFTFTALAAHSQYTCGLTAGGGLYCWGSTPLGSLPIPSLVPGGLTFTAVASGEVHACGRAGDGYVSCWGSNASGQLGTAAGSSGAAPARVVDQP